MSYEDQDFSGGYGMPTVISASVLNAARAKWPWMQDGRWVIDDALASLLEQRLDLTREIGFQDMGHDAKVFFHGRGPGGQTIEPV